MDNEGFAMDIVGASYGRSVTSGNASCPGDRDSCDGSAVDTRGYDRIFFAAGNAVTITNNGDISGNAVHRHLG